MHHLLAKRTKKMKASEIRELLKLTEQPDMISFAGGLPEAQFFPVEQIKHIRELVLTHNAKEALQYSVTEGFLPLREQIAERMRRDQGKTLQPEQILITNGSQQGLDLTGKIFLDEGDIILCESPTYLGALNAFQSYQPRFIEIEIDEEGMKMEHLDTVLNTYPVKMIYVNPNFQNPTGRSWSLARRRAFMERVQQTDVLVVEDNPYGDLWFEAAERPSLLSMDQKGCVVYMGSFSKIFFPGYRIGWIAAANHWMEKYVLAKQAIDLHSSTLNQREISLYLKHYSIDEHIQRLRLNYKKRRDAMLQALKVHLPDKVQYTKPDGGLFIWVQLPEDMNTSQLLENCLEHKVAFVPGEAFYPNGGHKNTLRLNYSCSDEGTILEGIRRLADVINSQM